MKLDIGTAHYPKAKEHERPEMESSSTFADEDSSAEE
jgi:hypothetical protein